MKTYKLFRVRNGKLYPLYVETNREIEVDKWLRAESGEKVDDTHVKSRLGALSRRPGWHSTYGITTIKTLLFSSLLFY